MLHLLTIPPAPQVLGPKEIERLAGLTTRAGLTTEIAGVKEVAAPYMEMNTKELIAEGAKLVKMGGVEGAKLVNASIVEGAKARATPYVEEAKARATPYVAEAKARATPYVAPYIAKGLDTKDAVMSDARVQKAVAALKGKFEQVRERPADVARELKTQTIDLIKYEKLGEYRAYVCSEHFVADTRRLVKEDLPSLAKEATRLGAHGVKAGAELMKEELAAAAALAAEAWAKGREEHSDLRSWEALSGLARVLVASLSSGLASRAEEAELRAKLAAMTARLQAVFGLGSAAAPAAAPEAPAEAQVATPNKIVGFEVEATSSSTVAVTLNSGAAEFVPNGHTDDGAEEEEEEDEDEDDDEYEDAPLSAEKPLM